jgi:hypothetical protein
MFANPFDLYSASIIFADWQYGMEPVRLGEDITYLGQARGVFPFLLNPLWDTLIWTLGGYGKDAQPVNDPLGFERIPRMAVQLLNNANLNNQLPEGMLRDAAGNPILLAERPITELMTKFASALGGVVLRDNAMPIPNLFASQQSTTSIYLYEVLMEEHPDWNANMLDREVQRQYDAVEAGSPASEDLLEAQRRYTSQQIVGPELEFGGLQVPGFLEGVVRQISPMQIQARPELWGVMREDAITIPGREAQRVPQFGDEYDAKEMVNSFYATNESRRLGIADEDWFGDSTLNDAASVYQDIGHGEAESITVEGVTYTNDDIRALSDNARWKLAHSYLSEQGYTPDDIELRNDQRRIMEENDPRLAGFEGYKDALRSYEGGPEAFVDAAYKSSPAFRDFMDSVPYEPGSPDWYGAADWKDAYLALEGNPESVYDKEPLPELGTMPGGVGDTSQYVTQRAETREGFSDTESFPAQIEHAANDLYYAQLLLDQNYPGYGYAVGAGNLPSDVWNTMRGVWEANSIDTSQITKDYHLGAKYVNWLRANPGGGVQDFIDATYPDDGSNSLLTEGATESAPIDVTQPPDPTAFNARFGIQAPQPKKTLALPAAPVDLRQSPGGPSMTLLDPRVVVQVLEVDANGWAHVVAPGGWEGYVPASSLKKAA